MLHTFRDHGSAGAPGVSPPTAPSSHATWVATPPHHPPAHASTACTAAVTEQSKWWEITNLPLRTLEKHERKTFKKKRFHQPNCQLSTLSMTTQTRVMSVQTNIDLSTVQGVLTPLAVAISIC
jgi:hypothetical protein